MHQMAYALGPLNANDKGRRLQYSTWPSNICVHSICNKSIQTLKRNTEELKHQNNQEWN